MTLEGKVKEIISNVLSTAPEHIRLEASLKDDLGATSMDRYTILMDIEDAFSLELDDVPEEELEDKIVTVADIVAFLKERVKE
jgi:acyl carrier protein